MGRSSALFTGPLDGPDFLFVGDFQVGGCGPHTSTLGLAVNECLASSYTGSLPNYSTDAGQDTAVVDHADLATPNTESDDPRTGTAPRPRRHSWRWMGSSPHSKNS